MVPSIVVQVLLALALVLFTLGCVILIVNKLKHRECTSRRTMVGKTVVITGGNSGIGKEAAIELASRGARVIIACRNESRGQAALDEIKRLTGGDVVLKVLDLCRLDTVRAFASDLLRTESRLDVLVNNAGIGNEPSIPTTVDGFEETFQANYLGHFLLTNLLLDLLKRSAPSRVIAVTSVMHRFGSNERLLSCCKKDDFSQVVPFYLYADSKLAVMHFVQELAERLENTGITVNGLHPGLVSTNIFKGSSKLIPLLKCGAYIWGKTARQGAQTTLHLALSDDVAYKTGKYFDECKEVGPSTELRDRNVRKALWEMSCRMTGLQDNCTDEVNPSA